MTTDLSHYCDGGSCDNGSQSYCDGSSCDNRLQSYCDSGSCGTIKPVPASL